MAIGDEEIDRVENDAIQVFDGFLNKLRNLGHQFLDRLNGTTIKIFGRTVFELCIPARADLPASATSAAKS